LTSAARGDRATPPLIIRLDWRHSKGRSKVPFFCEFPGAVMALEFLSSWTTIIYPLGSSISLNSLVTLPSKIYHLVIRFHTGVSIFSSRRREARTGYLWSTV
jgi:hypothetical protein